MTLRDVAGSDETQGWLLRSHEDRRCSILGPTESRISPSILSYTKIHSLSAEGHTHPALLLVTHNVDRT